MDIKIGAVFSLANETEEPNIGNIEIKKEKVDYDDINQSNALNENEDDIEVDQWGSSSPVLYDENISSCADWDSVTESASSEIGEPECPPFLSIESFPGEAPSVNMDWQDDILPPVLEPEKIDKMVTAETETEEFEKPSMKKRKCQKILPCYLALTNIDGIMNNKDAISIGQVKHVFKECPNMCKKHHFRRRLDAGKDVFNVKTPSRQRPYQLYLQKQSENELPKISGKKKLNGQKMVPNLAYLLALHDILKEKKKTSLGKKPVAKVRRTIHTTPADFKQMQNNDDNVCNGFGRRNIPDIKVRVIQQHQDKMLTLRRIHTKELNVLKAQIKLKRSTNKQLKKMRKLTSEPIFNTVTAGTSSKGRKRKCTSKYNDFIVTKTDVAYLEMLTRIQNLEKNLEKEQKRTKEELEHLRRKLSNPEFVSNYIDVVIDNPEKDNEAKLDQKYGAEAKPSNKKRRLKSSLAQKSMSSTKQESKGKLESNKVLIRDIPNENQFISDYLLKDVGSECYDSSDTFTNNATSVHTEYKISGPTDQFKSIKVKEEPFESYPYAKSLLKTSLLAKEASKRHNAQRSVQSYPTLVAPDLELEKAKTLRIPEKVQKLFKVKTEPVDIDDGYGAYVPVMTSSSSTNSCRVSSTLSSESVTKTSTSVPSVQVTPAQPSHTHVTNKPGSTSPLKTLILPALGVKGAPPQHMLLRPGLPPIPVMMKTAPDGGKMITVLTTASNSILTSTTTTGSGMFSTFSKPACPLVSTPSYVSGQSKVSSTSLLSQSSTQVSPTSSSMVIVNEAHYPPLQRKQNVDCIRFSRSPAQVVVYPSPNQVVKHPVKKAPTSGLVINGNPVQIVRPPLPNPTPPFVKLVTSQATPKPSLTTLASSLPTLASSLSIPALSRSTPEPSHPTPATSLPTPVLSPTTPVLSLPTPALSPRMPAASLPPPVPSLVPYSAPTATPTVPQGERCKFYLLKIDNKCVLIPTNPGQAGMSPTAFVVDSQTGTTTTTTNSATAPIRGVTQLKVGSPVKPTVVKPTATIMPSIKQLGITTHTPGTEQKIVTGTVMKVVDIVKESTNSAPQKQQAAHTITVRPNISKFEQSSAISNTVNQYVSDSTRTGFAGSSRDVLLRNPQIKNNQTVGDGVKGVVSYTTKVKVEPIDEDYAEQKTENNTSEHKAKDVPTTEDASDRFEKLRRLKELIKEKQKAVDEMRANRLKSSE